MTGFDILVTITVTGVTAFYMYRKKKKKENKTAIRELSNYEALRNGQRNAVHLHGVSVISFLYDSVAVYRDTEPDGTNTSFDLGCEDRLNAAIGALREDGYSLTVNAVSCVDRIVFYITY